MVVPVLWIMVILVLCICSVLCPVGNSCVWVVCGCSCVQAVCVCEIQCYMYVGNRALFICK